MKLQTVHAIYKDGELIFSDPALAPKGVKEVVVTYLEETVTNHSTPSDPIKALRGRGRGERLTKKLLQSRREDRERDERRQ